MRNYLVVGPGPCCWLVELSRAWAEQCLSILHLRVGFSNLWWDRFQACCLGESWRRNGRSRNLMGVTGTLGNFKWNIYLGERIMESCRWFRSPCKWSISSGGGTFPVSITQSVRDNCIGDWQCPALLGHLVRRTQASLECLEKPLRARDSREQIASKKVVFSLRDEGRHIRWSTFKAHEGYYW